MILTAAGATALVAAIPASAKKDPPVAAEYGPEPDWQQYKGLAEAAVRAQLVDPDSAQFSWPHGYVKRGYTPFLSKRVYGYATCGYVNSRNRMGGYVGRLPFVVVIDYGQVRYVEVSTAVTGIDLLERACLNGNFPPAPAPGAPTSAPSLRQGFDITTVPDGAYVSTVSPDGPANRATLKPGMVIERVNGIAVKGMEAGAVRQMLAGAKGTVTLDIIGGASIRIEAGAGK